MDTKSTPSPSSDAAKVVKPETWYRLYWLAMGLGFTLLNGYVTYLANRRAYRDAMWDYFWELQLFLQQTAQRGFMS